MEVISIILMAVGIFGAIVTSHLTGAMLFSKWEKHNKKKEEEEAVRKALEEIKQYRTIGTPEECRSAVEKQKAKKSQKTESEGHRYTDTYRCPNCGGNFSGTGIANYCYHCGQKLDWGDEE